MITIACPYCNAHVPVATQPAIGERISCPRCGDSFPFHAAQTLPAGTPSSVAPDAIQPFPGGTSSSVAPGSIQAYPGGIPSPLAPGTIDSLPERDRRWSNLVTVALLVGVMLLIAAFGVTYALNTEDIRRANDKLPQIPRFSLPFYLVTFVAMWFVGLVILLGVEFLARYRERDTSMDQAEFRSRAIRLGSALFMAVLTVTILGLQISRKTDPNRLPPGTTEHTTDEARDRLAGLGYLPADSDVIAVVQVSQLLKNDTGKDSLKNFQLGGTNLGIDTLVRCTGLTIDEIDQLTIGLRLNGRPRLILVAKTIKPYDLAAIHRKLKVDSEHKSHGKRLYRFQLEKELLGREAELLFPLGRKADLWCPSDNFLVVGMPPDDLDGMVGQRQLAAQIAGTQGMAPAGTPLGTLAMAFAAVREGYQDALTLDAVTLSRVLGVDRFSMSLQSQLNDPRYNSAPAWIIGNVPHHHNGLSLLLSVLYPTESKLLQHVQTAGVWFSQEQGMSLEAAILCTNAENARLVRDYFVRQKNIAAEFVQVEDNKVNLQIPLLQLKPSR